MGMTVQQEAARDHFRGSDRNLGLRARAGTGKSFTIKEMVRATDRRDRNLVVAYNKDIAEATRASLPRHIDVKTLHGLGYGAIQRYRGMKLTPDAQRLRGLARRIVPESPAYNHRGALALTLQLAEMGMCHLAETPEALLPLISAYGLLPDPAVPRTAYAGWAAELMRVCREEPASTISFDEMVYLPATLNILTGNYDGVLFDEAQDGNAAQSRLVLNARGDGGKAAIVYDDRQRIYVWRGARAQVLDDLLGTLNAEILPLTVTFRCPRRVVELARALVEDYEACDAAPEGYVTWESEDDLYAGARPGHVVIARSNAVLTRVCLRLAKRGVPARIVGRDYGERLQTLLDIAPCEGVKDLLTWLTEYQREEGDRLTAAGEEARAEELVEIVNAVRELTEGLRRKSELTRRINEVFVDPGGGAACVTCTSVHKAKGLQWGHVWLMESSFHLNNEEAENLYYVGVSRTQWTPEHPGHLRLVQTPRRDGSWPSSIAAELVGDDTASAWDADRP